MKAAGNSFCGRCKHQWPYANSDIPRTCLLCGNKERYVWVYKESVMTIGFATLPYEGKLYPMRDNQPGKRYVNADFSDSSIASPFKEVS